MEKRVSKRPAAEISGGAQSSESLLSAAQPEVALPLRSSAPQDAGAGPVEQAVVSQVPLAILLQILQMFQSIASSVATIASSQTQVQFLQASNWVASVLQDLAMASRLQICSMLYDHPEIHRAIMGRLGRQHVKGRGLAARIIVDASHHARRTCQYQQARLEMLVKSKAEVLLGDGERQDGILHTKIVILDERIVYLGSANVTFGSTNNREGLVRLVGGTVVQEVLGAVQSAAADARPLVLQ